MKRHHLEAGVAVGIFTLFVLAMTAVVWSLFNLLLGPTFATGVIFVVVLIVIGATVIDWITE